MSSDTATRPEAASSDETKLRACVERLTGGKVIAMERQIRWRPAWFVDVDRDGEILHIHIRGDRQSDVLPFPDLKREADILEVLGEHGIPAPKIYGMCEDPVAIIMETVPGTRDVSTAASDEERRAIARQYIDAIAAMHRLPLEAFAARGISIPEGAEAIALAGVNAYLPLYERHKKRPEPLIEFALAWLRAKVPQHRTRPSFIAFDAGQFLFENGRITALYDFEFAMVGDPMTDLATMAMRQSVEHMGDEISNLCRYYGEVTGDFDRTVMRYHHTLFATVACMQFVGAMGNPQPGEPNDVYTEWDLALRRSLILVLADCIGVELKAPAPVVAPESVNAPLMKMLADAIAQIGVADEVQQASKTAAQRLAEYIARVERYDAELHRLSADEAVAFLGERCDDPAQLDARMEAFVQREGAEHSAALIQYFSNQIERKVQVYGDTAMGISAAHVRLDPLD
ncbi:MAG: phosphotransferase family protein [Porticoccaceae bacterium]|jgi:aminoglycoside phosphotransferase|nr:phosphotransferase family protein [Porticoccaceae bacterium]HLS97562.1 phosphotransferase family protein [Porticoccaceae bacterium]